MKKIITNYWHVIVFASALLILYAGVNFQHLVFMRPMGEHAWAQIDRASIALMYYQNNADFLLPQTHSLAMNPSGIAIGEFPLQPYFVAQLYRIFGYHEYVYRLTVFLSTLLGFFVSFAIANHFLKNKWLVILVSLTWVLSPNLIYYSTGFVPDTFSLTLLLCGFWFLVKSYPLFSFRSLALFSFFAVFSLLEKSSALFIYSSTCLGVMLHLKQQQLKWSEIFKRIIILAAPFVILAAWIMHATLVRKQFLSNVFLLKPKLPLSLHDFVDILKHFAGKLSDYYSIFILLILVIIIIYYLFNLRKAPSFFNTIILFSSVGWMVFFVLLMRQAWFHGYYHIPFQMLVFIFLLTAALLFEKSDLSTKLKKYFPVFTILVFGFGFLSVHSYFTNRAWHYELINKDWMNAEASLTAAGITKDKKVVSYGDKSYNISLYLMNRRGWNMENEFMDYYIQLALKECDYLVTADQNIINHPAVKSFIGPMVGKNGSLFYYRIKH